MASTREHHVCHGCKMLDKSIAWADRIDALRSTVSMRAYSACVFRGSTAALCGALADFEATSVALFRATQFQSTTNDGFHPSRQRTEYHN